MTRSESGVPRLRFGVYPWAAPGAINPVNPQVPDDPYKALSAVKDLQGARSMTVHIYGQYTGADPGEADALISDARWWSDNGIRVETVLRFRPANSDLASGYVPWVEAVTARLAAIPGVTAIQIGNEANNTASGAAADGAYAGALQAIASGVPAARRSVVDAGRPDIRIGFNWAPGTAACEPDPFFAALRRAGGAALAEATSWVGIDVYPGTWSAPSPSVYPSSELIRSSIVSSLACLRRVQMPYAGLSKATTITVAETGWPTGANRSELMQAAVLRDIVGGVQSVSGLYGVTDLRWFDLPPMERARRGLTLLRAGYLGEPNGRVTPNPEATAVLFDGLRRQIDASVAPGATIQWDFSDAEPWHMRIDNGRSTVAQGRVEQADLTFHCRLVDWVEIAAGRTEPWRALLTGKVRPTGSLRMMVRVRKLFG